MAGLERTISSTRSANCIRYLTDYSHFHGRRTFNNIKWAGFHYDAAYIDKSQPTEMKHKGSVSDAGSSSAVYRIERG
jgi:hypothetical protein